VRPRSRRRCDRDGHPRGVRRVRPPGRSGGGQPLQGVLRRRGRHRLGRGRRHGAAGAALRRPPQRAPGARRRRGQRHQLRRRLQRSDRAQRPLPAARHPRRPGRGRVGARRRGRRGGWATRSRPRRCWPPTARTAPRTDRCCWAR
jgi:hypothetical protein